MTQRAKLCMYAGKKIGLTERLELTNCRRLHLKESTSVFQRVQQLAQILTYPPYPKTVLENKRTDSAKLATWKN